MHHLPTPASESLRARPGRFNRSGSSRYPSAWGALLRTSKLSRARTASAPIMRPPVRFGLLALVRLATGHPMPSRAAHSSLCIRSNASVEWTRLSTRNRPIGSAGSASGSSETTGPESPCPVCGGPCGHAAHEASPATPRFLRRSAPGARRRARGSPGAAPRSLLLSRHARRARSPPPSGRCRAGARLIRRPRARPEHEVVAVPARLVGSRARRPGAD